MSRVVRHDLTWLASSFYAFQITRACEIGFDGEFLLSTQKTKSIENRMKLLRALVGETARLRLVDEHRHRPEETKVSGSEIYRD
jgi:hypothetical protein